MDLLMNSERAQARWWPGRFELLWKLEHRSMEMDETIERLPWRTLRQNPDLRRYVAELGVPTWDLLAYQAMAEGAYGLVRVAALFPFSPFAGHHPEVFALDGDRRSKHRNPPWDNGEEAVSAHLCLYYRRDPSERRWTVDDELIRLFDLARKHLDAEHIWRETDKWPMDDAEHGPARPARRRPELKLPPLALTR